MSSTTRPRYSISSSWHAASSICGLAGSSVISLAPSDLRRRRATDYLGSSHHVDEPARDVDDAGHASPSVSALTLSRAMHDLLDLVSDGRPRHGHEVAQLAVDLNGQLDLVGASAPGRTPASARSGSTTTPRRPTARRRAPQLLADVRRDGREHQQQQPHRLVPRGSVPATSRAAQSDQPLVSSISAAIIVFQRSRRGRR